MESLRQNRNTNEKHKEQNRNKKSLRQRKEIK